MQKSLLRFGNAIRSEQTRKVYSYYPGKFLQFAKIKDPDDLLQIQDSVIQETLEEYLFYLKKTISPNSMNPRFAALELFFAMNDKNLNFKKIRKIFPATVKRAGKAKLFTVNSLTRSFDYLIKEANLNRSKEGQRHNIARFHGFRKRFNTILKDDLVGNIALKEKLMGHKGVFALDGSYPTPKLDTLSEEFKKHILQLTIDDSERKSIKLEQVQKEKSKVEAENVDLVISRTSII